MEMKNQMSLMSRCWVNQTRDARYPPTDCLVVQTKDSCHPVIDSFDYFWSGQCAFLFKGINTDIYWWQYRSQIVHY